jgi:hypothetical protein
MNEDVRKLIALEDQAELLDEIMREMAHSGRHGAAIAILCTITLSIMTYQQKSEWWSYLAFAIALVGGIAHYASSRYQFTIVARRRRMVDEALRRLDPERHPNLLENRWRYY